MATAEKGYFGGILKFMKIIRDRNCYVGMPCVDFYTLRLFRRIKIKIHDAIYQRNVDVIPTATQMFRIQNRLIFCSDYSLFNKT